MTNPWSTHWFSPPFGSTIWSSGFRRAHLGGPSLTFQEPRAAAHASLLAGRRCHPPDIPEDPDGWAMASRSRMELMNPGMKIKDMGRNTHLVGGLVAIFWIFPFILGCGHHPNWRSHIFQRAGPTTNQHIRKGHPQPPGWWRETHPTWSFLKPYYTWVKNEHTSKRCIFMHFFHIFLFGVVPKIDHDFCQSTFTWWFGRICLVPGSDDIHIIISWQCGNSCFPS